MLIDRNMILGVVVSLNNFSAEMEYIRLQLSSFWLGGRWGDVFKQFGQGTRPPPWRSLETRPRKLNIMKYRTEKEFWNLPWATEFHAKTKRFYGEDEHYGCMERKGQKHETETDKKTAYDTLRTLKNEGMMITVTLCTLLHRLEVEIRDL